MNLNGQDVIAVNSFDSIAAFERGMTMIDETGKLYVVKDLSFPRMKIGVDQVALLSFEEPFTGKELIIQ